MIPQIKEIGFGPGTDKSYATLHQATASFSEMGDRTISTQVRIDGDVTPDFSGWELEFKGERFILPILEPQATKDNTTRNSLIDLTFYSWPIYQMKRYFFMEMASTVAGVPVADKYNTTVNLSAPNFADLFNQVLDYYFHGKIRMDLNEQGLEPTALLPVAIEINKSYIWDVLTKVYELYGVRWVITYNSTEDVYYIKVGYAPESIIDHDFEYGYNGGLLRFERQVQDDNINNILLGRGGEKNLPYRYFKKEDEFNPDWAADPDAIPELANLYFDRLRDANFRWYIRGWVKNPNRDTSRDAGYSLPDYDVSDVPEKFLWAYRKGRYEDTSFAPIEYVKNQESIDKYGERWGAADDNDDIYPTIQGIEREGLARVDEVVSVSEILSDDIEQAAASAVEQNTLDGTFSVTHRFAGMQSFSDEFRSVDFSIPEGHVGNLDRVLLQPYRLVKSTARTTYESWTPVPVAQVVLDELSIDVINKETGAAIPASGIPAGEYYAKIRVRATNTGSTGLRFDVSYGYRSLTLTTGPVDGEEWKPTFDIYIKNIFETTQGATETDAQYAERVWLPILGDRLGNEAKIAFSDGFMSVSEDYDFVIVSYPVVDRTKTITTQYSDGRTVTVPSEWKITLRKSDAEYDATGLFIPNAQTGGAPVAGDHFYFLGIDMPQVYVEWAEERVTTNKEDQLDELKEIKPTWVVSLDKVRVNTLEDGEYGQTLAERLATGATIKTKDPRFTDNEPLTLYVQSMTYTWEEGTVIYPDIEVVLSDEVASTEGTVAKLTGDIDVIRRTYLKTSDIDAAIRRVTSPLYLRKTGEDETSLSPTTFASKVSSRDFRPGLIGGSGWGFTRDGAGLASLELDSLTIRRGLSVNSIVSNQTTYVGGKEITSAAAIECTQVVDDEDGYFCYFDQKQGSVANLFVEGDIAYSQVFDPQNMQVRYYRRRVEEVGDNYILLSKTNVDGTGVPASGDTIIQYGNDTDASRQFVIVRDVIGGGYEQMLSGLNSVSADGKEYYFAGGLDAPEIEREILADVNGLLLESSDGKQLSVGSNIIHHISPRWFVGDAAGEYAEWANGQLTVKGRIYVLSSDNSYVDMRDVLDDMADKDDFAQNLGYDDYEDMVAAAAGGATIIDGGYLRTSLINVQELIADSAFINDLVVSKLRATDATDGHGIIIDDKTIIAQDSDEVARVEIVGDSIGAPQGSSSISSLGIQSKSTLQNCSPGTTTIDLSSSSVSITASEETIVTVPSFSINISVRNDSPGVISTNLDRCQVAPYVRVYYGSRLVKQVYPRIAMDMRGKGRGESATATINVPYFTFATATNGEFSYDVSYELQTTETIGRDYTFAFSTASALSLDIAPIYLHTKLGSDGIRAQFSGNSYFEAKMSDGSSSAVTIRVGKYGIKVDGSGVYKYDYTNNSWVAVPSLM